MFQFPACKEEIGERISGGKEKIISVGDDHRGWHLGSENSCEGTTKSNLWYPVSWRRFGKKKKTDPRGIPEQLPGTLHSRLKTAIVCGVKPTWSVTRSPESTSSVRIDAWKVDLRCCCFWAETRLSRAPLASDRLSVLLLSVDQSIYLCNNLLLSLGDAPCLSRNLSVVLAVTIDQTPVLILAIFFIYCEKCRNDINEKDI